MHSTTTPINTTFELEEVGWGSFHAPFAVYCLGLEAEKRNGPSGWGLDWGWELDVGSWGQSVPGLAFQALSGTFGFFWISILGFGARSVAWRGAGFQRRGLGWAVCTADWDVASPWWRGWLAWLVRQHMSCGSVCSRHAGAPLGFGCGVGKVPILWR
ncbi:hypothetical protein CHARACLAT_031113, partial [Characodon lateralis]|nr:hypothetical protein [Characodon lateralis]